MKSTHKNNKGFTLAELLIVVAVIAVLVAVAVPTFGAQLEKSRQAVDVSNLRGAYAAAKIIAMDGKYDDGEGNLTDLGTTTATTLFYNPETGNLRVDGAKLSADGMQDDPADATKVKGYNKGSKAATIVADASNLPSTVGLKFTAADTASKTLSTDTTTINADRDKAVIAVYFDYSTEQGVWTPWVGFVTAPAKS